jgi:hypothetical protein
MIIIIARDMAKAKFMMEARMNGLTRKEAKMLWEDGIDTIHSPVETITIH